MLINNKFKKSIEFDRIISEVNRSDWKKLIEPLIDSTIIENGLRQCFIDNMVYEFIPEELDPNFHWSFDLNDIVTDGKDIMVITNLPLLDPRSNLDVTSKIEISKLQTYGNRYTVIKLDNNGNDKNLNDPYYYLHNTFNENQIWKVSDDVAEQYQNKIKGKKLY